MYIGRKDVQKGLDLVLFVIDPRNATSFLKTDRYSKAWLFFKMGSSVNVGEAIRKYLARS
jgi:hypothetical protein